MPTTRQGKANMPAVPLRSQSAGDGRGDRTDVARSIQQRKTAIASMIVRAS